MEDPKQRLKDIIAKIRQLAPKELVPVELKKLSTKLRHLRAKALDLRRRNKVEEEARLNEIIGLYAALRVEISNVQSTVALPDTDALVDGVFNIARERGEQVFNKQLERRSKFVFVICFITNFQSFHAIADILLIFLQLTRL